MATLGERLPQPEDGWRRYDNLYSAITYTGTWQTETLASNYNGSATFTQTNGATVNFSFQGTKIRIIGARLAGRTTTTQVIIDGTLRGTINETSTSGGLTQALVFDISGLTEGVHTVQIKTVDTALFIFDAIDIDADGYLLGRVSTTPESGWSRYDITTELLNVMFEGTWNANNAYTNGWGRTLVSTATNTFGKMGFWFYGTKLRIYDNASANRSTKNSVTIDGVSKIYSAYRASALDQVMVFEITDLALEYHYVEISIPSSETGKVLAIDSIEIDSTGEFRNPHSKFLLSSGDKYYSLINDGIQETTSIPKMTSNTTPEGEVLVSNTPNGTQTFGWESFDGGLSTGWGNNTLPTTMPKWIGYKFIKPKVIVKYRLYVTNTTYYPRNYEFQGSNDGVNYDTLHSIVGGASGVLDYVIPNRKSYIYYRLYITVLSSGVTLPAIYELQMFEMKPSYLVQMESATETDFLNRGVGDLNDFNQILKTKKNLKKGNTALGSGKTFEHTVDMSKRRVDKITLS
ncbi:discoidin domain-containing protein [Paenibacillus sp. SZ31]|uniref:discoidin domain-containing protein n=1 Tax=Paenibacillus sp. SZ31 TaxID=2725555 RepID=UPI00146EC680|nr:discoidin domain-containing protein [Paenibacillus sp. SZ31]NMI02857.1 discoidin domain-containing protein [Paenibacillus sp. SZ31]